MDLYLVNMLRADGSSDWRVYLTKGRASAATKLAIAGGRIEPVVGGRIYLVNTAGLQLVEEHGTLETHIEGQQALF